MNQNGNMKNTASISKTVSADHGNHSSPPCFAHEISTGQDGSFVPVDPQQKRDVMRWRKAERQRLIDDRLAVSAGRRQEWAQGIATHVLRSIGDTTERIVSFYWPFRGEPDLRLLMENVLAGGGSCALPVVVEKGRPLEFRSWEPGEPLERGVWNIPVPKRGNVVIPDVVLAPVVGFDPDCYRLGYGGGFFDRTLAALGTKPLVVGVAYAMAKIATIYPQPHDIAMSVIATEEGMVWPQSGTPEPHTNG